MEEIASGGLGIAYRTRQVSLDRTTVAKVIVTGAAASKEFIYRLRAGAAAAAALQHPNIVRIPEVLVHQGKNFLVMEHLLNASLPSDLKQSASNAWEKVSQWSDGLGRLPMPPSSTWVFKGE